MSNDNKMEVNPVTQYTQYLIIIHTLQLTSLSCNGFPLTVSDNESTTSCNALGIKNDYNKHKNTRSNMQRADVTVHLHVLGIVYLCTQQTLQIQMSTVHEMCFVLPVTD